MPRAKSTTLDDQWIPIADARPDDEEAVLIATHDGDVWLGYIDACEWRYVSTRPIEITVTHWMRLPAAPGVSA